MCVIMTVIGFNVTKYERVELMGLVRDMCLTKFAHPSDPGQFMTFLPVVTSEYIRYIQKVHHSLSERMWYVLTSKTSDVHAIQRR